MKKITTLLWSMTFTIILTSFWGIWLAPILRITYGRLIGAAMTFGYLLGCITIYTNNIKIKRKQRGSLEDN